MFLEKTWEIESQIISWHASGRRLLCFYHPVTIYELLRIKCLTVVESMIFIMSLDRCNCGACTDASWLKSRLYDLRHQNCWMNQCSPVELSRTAKIRIVLITSPPVEIGLRETRIQTK